MDSAPADVLGPVECKICRPDQRLNGTPVAWSGGRADTGANIERVLVDLIGLRQRIDDVLGKFGQALRVVGVPDDDGKLVATETRGPVCR